MIKLLALALTLLLHGSPLVVLAAKQTPPAPPKPAPTKLMMEDEDWQFRDNRHTGTITLACWRSYFGVGIRHGVTGNIWDVAPGGPADRADVRKGDILESWSYEGDYLVGIVRRAGVARPLRIKQETICQDRS